MSGVVLITGASRGIGAATARLLADRGCAVLLSYRQGRTEADALVRELTDRGWQAAACAADVSLEPDVTALFAFADEFSRRVGKPLVGLVNNAGIVDRKCPVSAMTAARLERMFGVNVIGSFLCAREAVRRMSTDTGGSGGAIVNLSSAAARLGSPGEFVDYAASKGAIDTFTVGLAREVAAQAIRVNAVSPGLIDTDIHADSGEPGRAERLRPAIPMRRIGRAEEVAHAIAWLLSDEASYTTGTVLDVTGGR